LECVEQESKLAPGLLLADVEEVEDALLDSPVVDSDAAAA